MKQDKKKTKAQLIEELVALRRRNGELEERAAQQPAEYGASTAARKSLELQQVAFEGSRDAIFISDAEGRFVDVNEAACRMTGYLREQLLQMRIPDLHDAPDLDVYNKYHSRIMSGEEVTSEAPILRADGTKVSAEFSNRRVMVRGAWYMHTVARDITDLKRTEDGLRASESRYRTLVEYSPAGIYQTDAHGKCTYVNPRLCEMAGLRLDGALGDGWTASLHPEDCDAVFKSWQAMVRDRSEWNDEYRFVNTKGEITWVAGYAVAILDENGQVTGYIGTNVDVSRRKEAEEELSSVVSLLDSVRQAQSLHIEEQDTETVFEELLSTLMSMTNSEFGFLDEVLYEPDGTPYKLSLAMSNLSWDSESTALYEQLRSRDLEFRDLRNLAGLPALQKKPVIANDAPHDPRSGGLPEGHPPIHSFMGLPIVSGDTIVGVAGVANRSGGYDEELAEFLAPYLSACAGIIQSVRLRNWKRDAEQALRQSEEEARRILAATTGGIWKWNFKTNELFFSDRYYTMLGYEPGEFPASFESWRDLLHPDDRDRAIAGAAEYLETKPDEYDNEFRLRTASGEYRWIRANARVVERDADGKAVLMIGNHEDITERKEAEAEKLEMEQRVQRAQKLESLGVLAGGIAHDFNNLLMAVIGYADIAMRKLSPAAPARDSVLKIQGAATRAAELADQMLAYSGRGKFLVERVNLSNLVLEMGHLLNASVSKTTLLHYELSETLPAVKVDATQIRQVVMNLITNASEALREQTGVVKVRTGVRECDKALFDEARIADGCADGTYVFVEVSDTGAGMDEETINKMFDPFFTTKFTGRGLGLAAVFGIVRGHKGALTVDSEPGTGTKIRVLLPACVEEMEEQPDSEAAELVGAGSGTVLLVDDESAVLEVGKDMLQMAGYNVKIARDGTEAVEIFRIHTREIHCVILDLTMPKMGGEEAIAELQRVDSSVPVLLSSGYSTSDLESHMADKGFAGFVKKPYMLDEIVKTLNRVMGQ